MELSEAFRLVNLVVAAIMVAGGIGCFLSGQPNIIVTGVYVVAFGACTALLEFQIPPQVSRYAAFLFSFLGRGIFYFFVACLMPTYWTLWIVLAVIVAFTGLAYAALHFVPTVEPPLNMREADAGWGAEQV